MALHVNQLYSMLGFYTVTLPGKGHTQIGMGPIHQRRRGAEVLFSSWIVSLTEKLEKKLSVLEHLSQPGFISCQVILVMKKRATNTVPNTKQSHPYIQVV